ncbi:MAG TPA: regulatory iron-sulfur-containing complex subunit RicT, partial [Candidatus Sulfotelmatobacter sp.]|nr:regulatory iron-sulfur-containing complex subunit RicT [Candidatus Sulfotelmatobacter sp.]
TRVELRQIGVRDESRILGCAGGCGRPACCRAFLQGFAPVSIRMAKDQNLALNPGKLSGICGRLKCCLTFEHSLYAELKRGLPKVGAHVATAQGVGTIRAQNILEQTVQVGLETGGQITLGATEVSVRPKPEPPPRPREAARPHGGQPSREPGRRPPRPAPPEPVSDNEVPADLKALEDS